MTSQETLGHAQTLVSGYHQVEEFGPDDDYEGEEETSYVTLDLGNVEPTLVPSASSYYLIVHRLPAYPNERDLTTRFDRASIPQRRFYSFRGQY
jgi:hypothetical protein